MIDKLRSRWTLLTGVIRCVTLSSLVPALRIALAGRQGDSADPADAVPIGMRACGGEPLYIRPGSSDLVNAVAYYRVGSERPPPGIDAPKVIVELGCNCGVSLTALAVSYPNARLVGVEPDGSNVATARRNLERFGDRASVVQGAMWDRNAKLVVDRSSPVGEHGFSVREAAPEDQTGMEAMDGITIDELLRDQLPAGETIDYLHVSIEGSEPRVLAAGGDWVDRVRSMKVELHPYFGYTAAECVPQLEELGFRAYEGERPPHTWVFGFRRD